MYIDIGTGSIFIQILIGVAIAIPALSVVYWGKVRSAFNNLFGKKKGK